MEEIRRLTRDYITKAGHEIRDMINDNGEVSVKRNIVHSTFFWGTHIIGSALWIGSFGVFAAPFLAGWGWIQTFSLFCLGQFASKVVFDLWDGLTKVSATLTRLSDILTRRNDKKNKAEVEA